MVISSNDTEFVSNISQEYIEHLKKAEQETAAQRTVAQVALTAAISARDEVQTWKLNVDGYWERVKATEEKYQGIKSLIENFKIKATAVDQNSNCVAEAAEILACMVRQMSKQTDELKISMRKVLERINSAPQNNAFRPFMNEFLTAVEDAITANVVAINKCLDVLKAAYLLHISIKGTRRLMEPDVRFPLDEKYRKIVIDNKPIPVLQYLQIERGLVSNLNNMVHIFSHGNAFPLRDETSPLCPHPLPIDVPPHFPLSEDPNGYYKRTQGQHTDAVNRLQDAEDDIYYVDPNNPTAPPTGKRVDFEQISAKYESIQRSLAAALDAKSKTR